MQRGPKRYKALSQCFDASTQDGIDGLARLANGAHAEDALVGQLARAVGGGAAFGVCNRVHEPTLDSHCPAICQRIGASAVLESQPDRRRRLARPAG
jgi:hypothetical protein